MSKQIQLRRGTTAEHATFAGAEGEVTVDTTKDTLVVHDGSLNGGYPLAKASEIANFITLNDISAGTGITYTAGEIAADTSVMATKSYVTTSITDAVALKDNTDEITEGANNLYFTTARARDAISVTDSGGDGSLSYANGVITYVGPSASDVRAHFTAGSGVSITDGSISVDTGTIASKSYVDSSITTAIATKDNTDEITEGTTNLYFTNTRARSAISITDAGGDGSLTYNTLTGAMVYTGPSAAEVRAHFTAGSGVTITSGQIAADTSVMATRSYVDTAVSAKDNTDEITEGLTNLYFTNARSRASVSVADNGGDGSLSYNSGTGVFSYTGPSAAEVRAHFTAGNGITISTGEVAVDTSVIATKTYVDTSVAGKDNTDEITEGTTNLYYTDARARASLSFSPGSGAYNSTTGAITIPTNTSQLANGAGFITSSDSITGSAAQLSTSRTISLSGDVTGSVLFNGSANADIVTTIAANSVALGTDTTGNYVASITNGSYITGGNGGSEGAGLTLAVDATSTNTASKVVARDASGNFSAGTITAALSGNATTATALQTARTISLTGDVTGSVSFDGSANAAISATIAANSVALGTDTTGNYVAGLTAGTGVTVSGTAGEGWSPTVAIGQAVGTTDNVTFNNLTLNGNLTVSGTTTTVSTSNLDISDPLIYIGTGNTGNSVDIGIVGHFNDGLYQHSGIVRKATADKWYLFSGMTTEPSTTITTTDATFSIDTLVANIEGNVTGNASTASAWQTARTITLGGDLTGSVSLDGSANVTLTATVAANSVALGTDTTGNYIAGITAGTGVTVSGSGSESATATISIGQAVGTTDSPTFDKIYTNNNGNGTNILIGDDAWIGDVNTANTIRITGNQTGTEGYIIFGNSNATALGRSGTGPLTYGGNTLWHAGNDGASSGLDADLLDGQQGTYYATASSVSSLSTTVDGKANKSNQNSLVNVSGTQTWDVSTYDTLYMMINGNTTLAISGVPSQTPASLTLIVKQDGSGGRTVTWPASFKFNGGIAPPQTTTANAVDVWSLFTYDGGSTYVVSLAVKDAK